jgi:hypothetical protein
VFFAVLFSLAMEEFGVSFPGEQNLLGVPMP